MSFKLGGTLVGIVVVGGLGLTLLTERVPQGYVGAVYDKYNGGIQNEVLTEGVNFVLPWQKVNLFATSTEVVYMSADEREGSKDNEEITINGNDGSMKADLSFRYCFDAEDVPSVQKKYRGKSGEKIMSELRGQMRGWISEITKDYSTMDIHLLKKDEINAKLVEMFNNKADKYGITFEEVTIMETRPSKEVLAAIDKRQQIAQELEQQKLSLEKAEIAKEQAKLEADKKLIIAEGEKAANAVITQGLTDAVLKQQAIEKWDGKLPSTMGADAIVAK